ncbi:MAG: fluoride exporter [Actinomycetota bacterium]|nr:fluoride exporter [Actinomycetota bacterium]MEA2566319.1 fluoride exporter [Actinomycetota bacterium]MEA2591852.1 fluoride exporter [Actinomycetota bacterium]
MSPWAWAGFVVAGAVGAPARYLLDDAISSRTQGVFPWGTLAINVSGSFLLGLLTGLALFHGLPATPRLILGTGFCGAYTTFSTFTYETVRLAEEGAVNEAVRNALASLVLGAAAAAAGLAAAAL